MPGFPTLTRYPISHDMCRRVFHLHPLPSWKWKCTSYQCLGSNTGNMPYDGYIIGCFDAALVEVSIDWSLCIYSRCHISMMKQSGRNPAVPRTKRSFQRKFQSMSSLSRMFQAQIFHVDLKFEHTVIQIFYVIKMHAWCVLHLYMHACLYFYPTNQVHLTLHITFCTCIWHVFFLHLSSGVLQCEFSNAKNKYAGEWSHSNSRFLFPMFSPINYNHSQQGFGEWWWPQQCWWSDRCQPGGVACADMSAGHLHWKTWFKTLASFAIFQKG